MFDIQVLTGSNPNVSKYVFTAPDRIAEGVLYRYPNYAERTVMCISTQSGCPVGCRFCGTGNQFVRSLTTEEICEQAHIMLADATLKENIFSREICKLQIMFMSMGEPLLNWDAVRDACVDLNATYPNAALLISTIAPRVNYDDLILTARLIDKIGLQFSVHESTDQARDKLIPFQAKLTLKEIAALGKRFFRNTLRKPFINYCASETNTTDDDVIRLAQIFDPDVFEATVSVICEKDESIAAAHARQRELTDSFAFKLAEEGFSVRIFDPAGADDIGGGCGQLWQTQKWMRDNPELVRIRND